MDLNTLSKSIELQIVNHPHGWGVSIEYTYRKTNQTITPLKAMYLEGHLGKTNEEHDVDKDEATFLSVELPTRPERGDKIVVNGVTWYVLRLLD